MPAEQLKGVDHLLAQDADLLRAARAGNDTAQIRKLTERIDRRLDRRLELTRQ